MKSGINIYNIGIMLIIWIYIFNGQFVDVVNDVNQDFSLKYSNNKMGINDMINKLSINNTCANLLH
jgi:hypothetical protein